MINRRHVVGALVSTVALAAGCTTTGPGGSDPSTRRNAIDAGIDNALANLYRQDPGARELLDRAKGVLIFPSVLGAGFIVGASRGDGALRKGGQTVSYHRTTSGSFGLQAGAQSSAVFIAFMTQDALTRFVSSRGWTAGVDATVTLLTVGANAQVTSATVQQPVVAYVLTNQGLMAGLTVDGTRITGIEL